MSKKESSPISLITGLIAAICVAIGFFVLYISHYVKDDAHKLLLEHAATIFIVVMTLHIVFEWRLIKHVVKIVKSENATIAPIVEAHTKSALAEFVQQYEISKSIRESGLVQIDENLDYDELKNMIMHTWNGQIKFLVISLPAIDRFSEAIKSAINKRNCTVQVLILDEDAKDTIHHRELSLGQDSGTIEKDILENKKVLKGIWESLDNSKKSKLQCYFYKQWVSVSMYVCNEELLFGHYFLGKKGTETHYFKVRGAESQLFVEFGAHFDEIWARSAKEENDVFRRK